MWIYVGNSFKVEVKGIGTCKLVMRKGHTLLLHDVLFAVEIHQILVFILVLIKLGFALNFHELGVQLFQGLSFMVLDIF